MSCKFQQEIDELYKLQSDYIKIERTLEEKVKDWCSHFLPNKYSVDAVFFEKDTCRVQLTRSFLGGQIKFHRGFYDLRELEDKYKRKFT